MTAEEWAQRVRALFDEIRADGYGIVGINTPCCCDSEALNIYCPTDNADVEF